MNKLRRVGSLNINDTRIAGLYDLEHTIGKGHFAVVKLARHVFTGEKVAVKVIDKTRLDPVSTSHMMQEVRCMKLVQHPNIIRLYEIIDTQTKLFLILELGDYDMYDYITKKEFDKGSSREADAQLYFSQIIKGIDYCHTLHVVHRDLKPENVIFFEKLGMVKLTDFGFSNLFTPGEQLETSCGSLAYSAPEILLGDAYDAPAVDVWSLGVILYMLVCGRLPFQEANESETLTKILDCKYTVPDYISPSCKNLISQMLVRDPAKRATLSEIIENPWVTAGERGHAEALPLIEREHLPESAHTTIIEQMIAGGIGTEEEIVYAIESDMYNYMTATYYLLAERVLAAYRQEQANRLLLVSAIPVGDVVDTENSENVPTTSGSSSSTPHTPIISGRSRSNSWRGSNNRRACTILKEESEEELSSYLRSSSRQSSRFFAVPPQHSSSARQSRAPSRANSTDSFMPEIHQILEDLEDEELGEPLDSEYGDFPDDEDFTVDEVLSINTIHSMPAGESHYLQVSSPSLRVLAPIREQLSKGSSPVDLSTKSKPSNLKLGTPESDGSAFLPPCGGSTARQPIILPPIPPPPTKSSLSATSAAGVSKGAFSHRFLRRPAATIRNAASLEFPSTEIKAPTPAFQQLQHNISNSPIDIFGSTMSTPTTPASWTSTGGILIGVGDGSKEFELNTPVLRRMKSEDSVNDNDGGMMLQLDKSSSFAGTSPRVLPLGMQPTWHKVRASSAFGTTTPSSNFIGSPLSGGGSGKSFGASLRKRRFSQQSMMPSPLNRRNSSPSVSMFGGVCVSGGGSGMRSSRERVSPQAIQELLEFSRFSGGMRRAASPDSRISSRSSSPPCSSGRASPAITGIVSRLKASNLLPSVNGMRKLSSSPHLLGICEEGEDGAGTSCDSSSPFCTNKHKKSFNASGGSGISVAGSSPASSGFKAHIGRGNRSASIGFAQTRGGTSLLRSSDINVSRNNFGLFSSADAAGKLSTSGLKIAATSNSGGAETGAVDTLVVECNIDDGTSQHRSRAAEFTINAEQPSTERIATSATVRLKRASDDASNAALTSPSRSHCHQHTPLHKTDSASSSRSTASSNNGSGCGVSSSRKSSGGRRVATLSSSEQQKQQGESRLLISSRSISPTSTRMVSGEATEIQHVIVNHIT